MEDDELEAYFAFEARDPADIYEDEYAFLLGHEWEPWTSYDAWRDSRRLLIRIHGDDDELEALAGLAADRKLKEHGSLL